MRNLMAISMIVTLGVFGLGCDDGSPSGTGTDGAVDTPVVDSGLSAALDASQPPLEDGGSLAEDAGHAQSHLDAAAATDAGVAPPTGLGCESSPEAADLCFLREEEKLARDVYITLFEIHDINVFDNISRSEQSHTDTIAGLLASRSIPDPVTDDTVGVFINAELDALYDELTTQGASTEVAALMVGATIEDLDIRDIVAMETRTDDAEILTAYDSLLCGSRNHMRSFISQLGTRGETYSPSFISVDEFEAIVRARVKINRSFERSASSVIRGST